MSRAAARRVGYAVTGRYHRAALGVFMAVVLAHLAEHVVQAIQIYALGWAPPQARGVLGTAFPWLVTSEVLHYAYAVAMLVGLIVLRGGFAGASRRLWDVALAIQVWHHLEHALLLVQATTARTLFGAEVPTSIAQLVVPRVELHLLYNTLVLIPMLAAIAADRAGGAEDRVALA